MATWRGVRQIACQIGNFWLGRYQIDKLTLFQANKFLWNRKFVELHYLLNLWLSVACSAVVVVSQHCNTTTNFERLLVTYLSTILLRKFYFLSWILLEIKKSLQGQQNMINAMAKFLNILYLPIMKLSVIWKSVWGSDLVFLGQHFKWTIFSVVDWGNNCCCL